MQLRAPLSLDINVTRECNFHCSFCSATPIGRGLGRDELTLSEIDNIFRYADENGVFVVRIAGGEPLVRQDFREIARAASCYSFTKILLTNGSLLDDDKVAMLSESKFDSVALSVDGHVPSIHEKSRASPGSFETLLRSVEILRRGGLPHTAMVTVTKYNVEWLVEILDLLVSMEFYSVRFLLLAASGKARHRKALFPDYATWSKELLRLTVHIDRTQPLIDYSVLPPHEDPIPYELYYPLKQAGRLDLLESVWKIRYSTKTAKKIGCAAGQTQMTIFENGDVYGCDLMRDAPQWRAGNIRDSSLDEIWRNSETFTALRSMKKSELGGACGSCSVSICGGGCRASALSTSGRINGADQTCML
ncbi:radical SAM/SPASM domain-containing protein [Rhizobium sp. WYCCWR 11146]|uniref:radical SAM/SPASM domain-containing protein n=1 Tax=Rhizobium sp. WYCCWR 11146 TaxID=2749833 RepID=UPI0015E7AB9D|nr:radical SAM protein [Rhizobium sp. WYCCWR 11146]MBA1344964.1 radical SAM protein [Rhizobium sp. WYCCWR 11146]